MPLTITDCSDVSEKMTELGCVLPVSGLALLPYNFDSAASVSELRHASETSTVRKLLLHARLPLGDIARPGERPPYVKNKSSDLVLPTLFFSASFLSQNSALVTVALNVVSNYVYESLRHLRSGRVVKVAIVVEDKGKYRRISYEGTEEGLNALPDSIREAIK